MHPDGAVAVRVRLENVNDDVMIVQIRKVGLVQSPTRLPFRRKFHA